LLWKHLQEIILIFIKQLCNLFLVINIYITTCSFESKPFHKQLPHRKHHGERPVN
jgi:hypothetical protein